MMEHVRMGLGEDDHLLLDDVNINHTAENRCWKCRGTGLLQTDPIEWLHSNAKDLLHVQLPVQTPQTASVFDDSYTLELDDSPDSPLLNDDHIGHLSLKEFHCHTFNGPDNNGQALKTLCIVSMFCFVFMLMEIIGGHIAGSLAVMTDAAHLFSDIIGFLVSILSIWIGRKPKTKKMTFGFYRVEVVGAFISVLIVWLLAGLFSIIAIDRMLRNELNIDADIMLIVASFGVAINLIMGAILHGTCISSTRHQHSHGAHSHTENINIRAAAAHVVGDLLQSLGVLLAAIVVKVYPSAAIADPICTILFSVIVVAVTFRVARDSLLVLIEATPASVDVHVISAELHGIVGVMQVHSLNVWTLAPGKEAFGVHLAVDANCDRDIVLNQALSIVRRRMNAVSCAIQVERYDHEQMSICLDCQQ